MLELCEDIVLYIHCSWQSEMVQANVIPIECLGVHIHSNISWFAISFRNKTLKKKLYLVYITIIEHSCSINPCNNILSCFFINCALFSLLLQRRVFISTSALFILMLDGVVPDTVHNKSSRSSDY